MAFKKDNPLSRSASGQLQVSASSPTLKTGSGAQAPAFATRPLPSLPAAPGPATATLPTFGQTASLATPTRSLTGALGAQTPPATSPAKPNVPAAPVVAPANTGLVGQAPSAATQAFGQNLPKPPAAPKTPVMPPASNAPAPLASGYGASKTAMYGQSPAATYAQNANTNPGAGFVGYPPAGVGYTQSAPAYNPPRPTATYGNYFRPPTATVLPPVNYNSSKTSLMNGNMETEVILRSDLKSLKRGRWKAKAAMWLTFVALGGGVYLALMDRRHLVAEAEGARQELNDFKQLNRETLARISVSERIAEEARAAAKAAGDAAAATASGAAAVAVATNAETEKLKSSLQTELTGSQVQVLTRGDSAVVAIDPLELFSDSKFDIGLDGYRVLYRVGKALKSVDDRRIIVTVPARDGTADKKWFLAGARGVALGQFFVNDLKLDPSRVTVVAEPEARGMEQVEISLAPGFPVRNKS